VVTRNHHSYSKFLKKSFKAVLLSVLALLTGFRNDQSLPDPLQAGWQGEEVCELLEEQSSLRVLKCTFLPGVGHERHFHAAHFGYTLKGSSFQITDSEGTRVVNVPTGSSFYNEEIVWHEVLNIGDSTAVFLIMEPKS
jgi:quercetin dioxygenase-like cupin family protein